VQVAVREGSVKIWHVKSRHSTKLVVAESLEDAIRKYKAYADAKVTDTPPELHHKDRFPTEPTSVVFLGDAIE